jgi:predicted  nucleic acid-binding Zn-ribbon protein
VSPVAATVLAALIAGLATYIAAARRLSGKIDTSEAQSLWAESASIRDDYRNRIAHAEERQAALEKRVADLEKANTDLRNENLKLREQNLECERKIAQLTERCEHLARENDRLRRTIQRLGGFDDDPGEPERTS